MQLVFGLMRRMHLERLGARYNPTVVLAIFNLINGMISICLLAVLALTTGSGFIFPSLGATAFLLFHVPLSESASPRNILIGHTLAACIGWLCLVMFGLLHAPPVTTVIEPIRALAAATALGVTSALMVLLRAVHPPASATALIVTFGLMPNLARLPVLLVAVMVLLLQAFVMNRLAGIPYPLWSKPSRKKVSPAEVEETSDQD